MKLVAWIEVETEEEPRVAVNKLTEAFTIALDELYDEFEIAVEREEEEEDD